MNKYIAFCLAFFLGSTITAQTINLSGTVSNRTGQPVPKAVITLVGQAMTDTTGNDGKYSFTKNTTATLPAIVPQLEEISIKSGVLQLTSGSSSPVKIEIFDIKGNLLKNEISADASAGAYRVNIAKNCFATNLLVIKVTLGKREMSFPCVMLDNGNYSLYRFGAYASSAGQGLGKIAATLDTLLITATDFKTKVVPVISYENQQLDISLDSASVSGDTGRSTGCGRALSDLKSGTYTIASAGLSRQYIIDIPANYDPDKPYRLIFAMHWSGGSMQAVANDKFYSLKTYADNDNAPCIFVAPNGTGSPLGWGQAEKDHVLFDDLYKLVTEKLCIDTKRVFCAGFSYGALFTYSLSLSHQKVLRAVACYAPANWNTYFPENTHEPIAFYATTGTNEPNCKFIYDEEKKLGVKYCLLQHSEDNGCIEPANIPLATSQKHVSTEFSGCKPGYPVKFSSFQGMTSFNEKDPGSNVNWIAEETWEFFNRF